MLIYRDYNEEKKLDRVWYNSSMIVYSECDDKEDSLKTLRVTFKNGATYEYKDVDVNDYVMFVHGGIDGSNGKALNKMIKEKKYEYKKLEDISIEKLNEDLQKLQEEKIESEIENENTGE